MAAAKKKKETEVKAVEQEAPKITLVDTLFKTDTITMDPEAIYGIVSKGSQISIYTNMSTTPIQVPAEKGEDGKPIELETYTLRLAVAREAKVLFDQARITAEAQRGAVPVKAQEVLTS